MTGISISEIDVLQVLGNFLTTILSPSVTIATGQDNRVSEPLAGDFVIMTPLMRDRLATNIDNDIDTVLTGSIASTTLTVSAMRFGYILLGMTVFGVDIQTGTTILSQESGTPGGIGRYIVSVPQTLSSRTLSTGAHDMLQPLKLSVQLDVHGPLSADNATIITTALRDSSAADFFTSDGHGIQPLYAGEPRQAAFINGEDQYEGRWTFDAIMQANPVISTPQQFADTVAVQLVEIDAAYPP